MSVIDDLATAVQQYLADKCKVEIVDVTGFGRHLVVGEIANFKVKVSNNGDLDMKMICVQVSGSKFADIVGMPAAFMFLEAGKSDTRPFRARATQPTGGQADIVSARIIGWNASMDHILTDHSGASAVPTALNMVIEVN